MATRSRIGIKNPDGTIVSVYCHWDGYLSNNGKILLNHYNDEDKIYDLITRGDLSFLEEDVNKCKFYQDNNRAIAHKTEDEYYDNGESFNYLYKNGKWYYNNFYNKNFIELTEEKIKEEG